MKYLYLKSPDPKFSKLVPVDAALSIEKHNGLAYLMCGSAMVIDVDKANEVALLPFLADAFNKCDVVALNLIETPAPIIKRGLEE